MFLLSKFAFLFLFSQLVVPFGALVVAQGDILEIIEILPYEKNKLIQKDSPCRPSHSFYDDCYGRGSIFQVMKKVEGKDGYYRRKGKESHNLTWHETKKGELAEKNRTWIIDGKNFIKVRLTIEYEEEDFYPVDDPVTKSVEIDINRYFFSGIKAGRNGDWLFVNSKEVFKDKIGDGTDSARNLLDFRYAIYNHFLISSFDPNHFLDIRTYAGIGSIRGDNVAGTLSMLAPVIERDVDNNTIDSLFGEEKNVVFGGSPKGFATCFHQSEQTFLRWLFNVPENPDDSSGLSLENFGKSLEKMSNFAVDRVEEKSGELLGTIIIFPKYFVHVASLRYICKFCRGTFYKVQDRVRDVISKYIENYRYKLKEDQSFIGPFMKDYDEAKPKTLKLEIGEREKPRIRFFLSGHMECDPWLAGKNGD